MFNPLRKLQDAVRSVNPKTSLWSQIESIRLAANIPEKTTDHLMIKSENDDEDSPSEALKQMRSVSSSTESNNPLFFQQNMKITESNDLILNELPVPVFYESFQMYDDPVPKEFSNLGDRRLPCEIIESLLSAGKKLPNEFLNINQTDIHISKDHLIIKPLSKLYENIDLARGIRRKSHHLSEQESLLADYVLMRWSEGYTSKLSKYKDRDIRYSDYLSQPQILLPQIEQVRGALNLTEELSNQTIYFLNSVFIMTYLLSMGRKLLQTKKTDRYIKKTLSPSLSITMFKTSQPNNIQETKLNYYFEGTGFKGKPLANAITPVCKSQLYITSLADLEHKTTCFALQSTYSSCFNQDTLLYETLLLYAINPTLSVGNVLSMMWYIQNENKSPSDIVALLANKTADLPPMNSAGMMAIALVMYQSHFISPYSLFIEKAFPATKNDGDNMFLGCFNKIFAAYAGLKGNASQVAATFCNDELDKVVSWITEENLMKTHNMAELKQHKAEDIKFKTVMEHASTKSSNMSYFENGKLRRVTTQVWFALTFLASMSVLLAGSIITLVLRIMQFVLPFIVIFVKAQVNSLREISIVDIFTKMVLSWIEQIFQHTSSYSFVNFIFQALGKGGKVLNMILTFIHHINNHTQGKKPTKGKTYAAFLSLDYKAWNQLLCLEVMGRIGSRMLKVMGNSDGFCKVVELVCRWYSTRHILLPHKYLRRLYNLHTNEKMNSEQIKNFISRFPIIHRIFEDIYRLPNGVLRRFDENGSTPIPSVDGWGQGLLGNMSSEVGVIITQYILDQIKAELQKTIGVEFQFVQTSDDLLVLALFDKELTHDEIYTNILEAFDHKSGLLGMKLSRHKCLISWNGHVMFNSQAYDLKTGQETPSPFRTIKSYCSNPMLYDPYESASNLQSSLAESKFQCIPNHITTKITNHVLLLSMVQRGHTQFPSYYANVCSTFENHPPSCITGVCDYRKFPEYKMIDPKLVDLANTYSIQDNERKKTAEHILYKCFKMSNTGTCEYYKLTSIDSVKLKLLRSAECRIRNKYGPDFKNSMDQLKMLLQNSKVSKVIKAEHYEILITNHRPSIHLNNIDLLPSAPYYVPYLNIHPDETKIVTNLVTSLESPSAKGPLAKHIVAVIPQLCPKSSLHMKDFETSLEAISIMTSERGNTKDSLAHESIALALSVYDNYDKVPNKLMKIRAPCVALQNIYNLYFSPDKRMPKMGQSMHSYLSNNLPICPWVISQENGIHIGIYCLIRYRNNNVSLVDVYIMRDLILAGHFSVIRGEGPAAWEPIPLCTSDYNIPGCMIEDLDLSIDPQSLLVDLQAIKCVSFKDYKIKWSFDRVADEYKRDQLSEDLRAYYNTAALRSFDFYDQFERHRGYHDPGIVDDRMILYQMSMPVLKLNLHTGNQPFLVIEDSLAQVLDMMNIGEDKLVVVYQILRKVGVLSAIKHQNSPLDKMIIQHMASLANSWQHPDNLQDILEKGFPFIEKSSSIKLLMMMMEPDYLPGDNKLAAVWNGLLINPDLNHQEHKVRESLIERIKNLSQNMKIAEGPQRVIEEDIDKELEEILGGTKISMDGFTDIDRIASLHEMEQEHQPDQTLLINDGNQEKVKEVYEEVLSQADYYQQLSEAISRDDYHRILQIYPGLSASLRRSANHILREYFQLKETEEVNRETILKEIEKRDAFASKNKSSGTTNVTTSSRSNILQTANSKDKLKPKLKTQSTEPLHTQINNVYGERKMQPPVTNSTQKNEPIRMNRQPRPADKLEDTSMPMSKSLQMTTRQPSVPARPLTERERKAIEEDNLLELLEKDD